MVTADLIIAADGVHSAAVEAILGHSNPPQMAKHNNCCYRFLISRVELEAHDDTKSFVEPPDSLICRIFADQERSRRLVTYPCRKYVLLQGLPALTDTRRSYEVINFVGICRVENFSDSKEGSVSDSREHLPKLTAVQTGNAQSIDLRS